jgi:ABC-type multidrug transport system fused ATPase/permease subunit
MNTVVGERGSTLSGGQRQRIAMARAFLKDAPILILDEATSALDVESEAAVARNLTELAAGRTTVVIAHRLSTIRIAKRVILLQNGRIVGDGTLAELGENHPLIRQLEE